jgi:hypothetical protein
MNDDIVTRLRQFGDSNGLDAEAADEIERLRSINRAITDAYESLKERHRSYNNQQIGVFQRTIKELETKIGWYKAVNAQLRDDLIEANADFQALARTPAPTFDHRRPLASLHRHATHRPDQTRLTARRRHQP